MKQFETIKKNLVPLGFDQNHVDDYCHYPLKGRHSTVQSVLISLLIMLFVFAFHIADSPKEYMDSFYVITVIMAIFISYTTAIYKMNNLFNFIDDCEKLYDDSK